MSLNISYWESTSFYRGYDVLIIGSGIVGLSAALNLKLREPKLKVGILESGFLPSGASTKNAGFACFGSVSELLEALKSTSEEEVLKVVELRWKGLSRLKQTLGENAIDFKQLGGYEIFRSEEKIFADACTDQIDYLNKLLSDVIGKSDIYAVSNDKIAVFGFSGLHSMIMNQYEAQIDTGLMMSSLINKVTSLGVKIFNSCTLQRLEVEHSNHLLKTSQGDFRTKKVIMATNAFIGEFYPELNVIPGRGQVLVTEPIAQLKVNGAFHYDRGYYYFRNINDRILLGGGRNIDFTAEETTEPRTTEEVQNALEELLYSTILPGKRPKIDYRWSGVMAFGEKLKPIIKELKPGIFCAVRCNGMGVAMGSLSGEQVAELLLEGL